MADERVAAAFVDRDGVINEERGHVHRIDDFQLLPGVVDGLRLLARSGFALVVVTNQAGIAKGLYSEEDYAVLTRHMRSLLRREGVDLAGVYHCPHHPGAVVARLARICDCRKPAPGMLIRAAAELDLDLSRSVLIGDKTSDTLAGRAAGVALTVLVDSGHTLPDDWMTCADHRAADLDDAAHYIAQQRRHSGVEAT